LRFLFKNALRRRDRAFDDLPFPKTPKKVPALLSDEEVVRERLRTVMLPPNQ
jgi:hypothetical protein